MSELPTAELPTPDLPTADLPTPDLPTGTVTLVFTDIQGSSELWGAHGNAFQAVLEAHNRLMRDTAARWNGYEVKTEGDAFFLAFARASDAVQFAVEAQRALANHCWGSLLPGLADLRVRMGMHTGEPLLSQDPNGRPDYFGPTVNRAARVGAAGHGGQIILSESTYTLVRGTLGPVMAFQDRGSHRLKGVGEEHLWQVTHPELPQNFPTLRTLDAVRHNLPLQPTPFIGREREVQNARSLLSGARLLTLTGPGGTGKTRLGLRIAEEIVNEFDGGACFVDLASTRDPHLVAIAIAETLGLPGDESGKVMDSLKDYLGDKQMLLLLDNFEQVLEAAPVVAELLASCPRLKALVTSRAALHLRAEQECPVPEMEMPDLRRLPSPEKLSQYAAVELFLQRARAVKPDFQVTNENAPAVAEICARLDGLPLAIELAAARVKLLSPESILSRLENRLKLVTGGARDLPARQQTLRNAIAWGYDLLDSGEQRLFRRLAVFAGGCTLEAAEVVCSLEGDLEGDLEGGLSDIMDGVDSLVDKNLLRRMEAENRRPRYLLLETIREFAEERLVESGEEDTVKWRHARFFLSIAEEAKPKLYRAAEADPELRAEYDNLRAALEHLASADLSPSTNQEVQGAIARLLPPRNHQEAQMLAAARHLAVPHLGNYVRSFDLLDITTLHAIFSLGLIGTDLAREELRRCADTMTDSHIRAYIIGVLARMRGTEIVEVVMSYLNDPDEAVRETAAAATGELEDTRAVAPLIARLEDSSSQVRMAAALSLGKLKHRDAEEPLKALLNAPESGARMKEAVTIALKQLKAQTRLRHEQETQIHVEVDIGRGITIFHVMGELDALAGPTLEQEATLAFFGGIRNCIVDLTQATFIDSVGVGALIRTHRIAAEYEGWMYCAGAKGMIAQLLKVTALDRIFKVFATLDEALEQADVNAQERGEQDE